MAAQGRVNLVRFDFRFLKRESVSGGPTVKEGARERPEAGPGVKQPAGLEGARRKQRRHEPRDRRGRHELAQCRLAFEGNPRRDLPAHAVRVSEELNRFVLGVA